MLLVLATVGLVWFLVNSTSRALNTVNTVLDPLQRTNNELSTQVAGLLHPTPTVIPDPVTIIDKVRAVAQLQTIHYTVEKVITAEVNQGVLGPLFGDRLLFVAHGYVIAGVDLGKITAEDMWLEGGMLHVRLPQAEILVCTLDEQKSYVYDRQTGALTHGDPNLETAARQVAVEEICKAALEDGILDQAQINANLFLERFFQNLGYQAVIFEEPKP
ncbi:MAG: hypothetical protein FD146_893 [Anaerolineaceae bacterium]|nr:MAG: hypothetical protein FD146_893 [Anaerolineaceae bacterium]